LRDWLIEQVTFLGNPFQTWMVVALALILIATIINLGERR
jgi:dolichyl-phosphate-mannose--protein O-mannosyl transferase